MLAFLSFIMQFRQPIRAAFLLAPLAAGIPFEAGAATAIGTATAVVVRPLSVDASKPLVFGAIQSRTGVVRVAPNGERDGDSSALVGAGASAGEVTIRGEANATYTVSGTGGTLVDMAGGASMAITDLRFADAATPEAELTTGVLRDGVQVLKVGATLALSDGQETGSYAGSYVVTVNYN